MTLSFNCRAAAILTLFASVASAQVVVVTPSSPQGWGDDPFHFPITGAQAITGNQPRSGNGSLEMTVHDNGAEQTGYGLFAPGFLGGANLGTLSSLTSLGFDWNAAAPALQSPTLRLYLSVADPLGAPGDRMVGQLGWYADGSINGPVPTATWTTTNIFDADGNNNFFLRFFGGHSLPSGQIATSCTNADRGSDFNARMQSISAWQTACDGSAGKLNLADATVFAVSLDMGRFGALGGTTAYTTYSDNVVLGFGTALAKTYNFELDATPTATPEPATVTMLATGLLGLIAVGKARRRKAV